MKLELWKAEVQGSALGPLERSCNAVGYSKEACFLELRCLTEAERHIQAD